MKYSGLIFDFNGVLWWDNHLQEASWQVFSQSLIGRPLTHDEMAEYMHGRPNKAVMEYMLDRPVTGAELERLTDEKEGVYRQMCLTQGDDFRLSPGAVELLDALVDRAIPHTIATASERSNLDFFIKHLDLAKWFDLSKIIYDNGQRAGKPAPDYYLAAAEQIELAPSQCVVIEDATSGLAAAHAAGIGYIFALSPKEHHPRLSQIECVSAVIESLAELPLDRLF